MKFLRAFELSIFLFHFIVFLSSSLPAGVINPNKLWPLGSTLHVLFLDGSAEDHEFVKREASEWMDYANIKFEFYADRSARQSFNVRINFSGCDNSSKIGTDASLIPFGATMSLPILKTESPLAYKARVVKHEFGHMLGLDHEHQNPNFPYTVNKSVRCSRERMGEIIDRTRDQCMTPAFKALPRVLQVTMRVQSCESNTLAMNTKKMEYGEFDEKSVMFYGFLKGELEEIDQVLSTPMKISEEDARFIQKYYPFQ